MAQGHHHHKPEADRRLGFVIILNVGITLAQIIGGVLAGSLALISDALHNLSDVGALIITGVARKLAGKPYTKQMTFGYRRAEILAALVNSATIIGVAIYIMVESVIRLYSPEVETVDSILVIWLAGIAVVFNGLSTWLLYLDSKGSVNMKSAFIHLLADTLFSVAVLIGGILMYFLGIYWVDSLLSIGIAIYLIYISWDLILESSRIIMQFAPGDLDLEEIARAIEEFPGIKNIHHSHVWRLDDHAIHYEAHVDMERDMPLSEACRLMDEVQVWLREKYGIVHCALQPEFGMEDPKDLVVDDRLEE